jgi:hypothetical protein
MPRPTSPKSEPSQWSASTTHSTHRLMSSGSAHGGAAFFAMERLRAAVQAVLPHSAGPADTTAVEPARRAPASKIESLNYEWAEQELTGQTARMHPKLQRQMQQRQMYTLTALIVLIGFLVGSVAYAIGYTVEHLGKAIRDPVQSRVQSGSHFEAYLIYSGFSLLLILIAACLTYWAPQAAGSGIPHVKAFLNGCRLQGILKLRTLVAKVLGIACCVTIGMPAGREGPMVHAGIDSIVISIVSAVGRDGTRRHRQHSHQYSKCSR